MHNSKCMVMLIPLLCALSGCEQSDFGSICICNDALREQNALIDIEKDVAAREASMENLRLKLEIERLDAEIEKNQKDYLSATAEFFEDTGQPLDILAENDSEEQAAPKPANNNEPQQNANANQPSAEATPQYNVVTQVRYIDDQSLNKREFDKAIMNQRNLLEPCFQGIDSLNNYGQIEVHIQVEDGKPQNAIVVQSDIDNREFQTCITDTLSKFSYPGKSKNYAITTAVRYAKKPGTSTTQPADPNSIGLLTIQSDAGDQAKYYINGKMVVQDSPIENYQIISGTHTARAYFMSTRKFSKSLTFEIEKGYHTTLSFNTSEEPKVVSKTKMPKTSGNKKPSTSKTSKRNTKRPVDSSFDIPF